MDCHIYLDHEDGLKQQISRTPFPFPKLKIVDRCQTKVEDFRFDDFIIYDYKCHDKMKLNMAV
jgi:thymidylate synthase